MALDAPDDRKAAVFYTSDIALYEILSVNIMMRRTVLSMKSAPGWGSQNIMQQSLNITRHFYCNILTKS
eukprot:106974-Hanusia_phi.AAC.3